MQTYNSICVPVDFSPASRQAFDFARQVFRGPEARIQPTHILSHLPAHVREVLFPYAALGEDEVEFEHEIVENVRARICDHLGISLEGKGALQPPNVSLGDPKEVLPDLIASSATELVVMSAFGESGAYPDSVGSVPDRLVRTVRQPILLTRDFDTHPEINRILVASDLTRANASVYAAALRLGVDLGASVEALFVLPDPLTLDTNNILRHVVKFDHNQVLGRSRDRVDALFDRLAENIGKVDFAEKDAVQELMKRRKILVGDPAIEVLNRAEQISADLIVVGTQKAEQGGKMRLGTVASQVIRRASTHVLVVPVDPTPQLSDES